MKTHLKLMIFFLCLSAQSVFAQANKDKIMKAAVNTSLEVHRETEKLIEPYLKKVDKDAERSELLDKDDDSGDDSKSQAKGQKQDQSGQAPSQPTSSSNAGSISSQKRVGGTGDVGGAAGAGQIKFEKEKDVIPADAVY